MATYTYRCFDRVTMQELGQLPMHGVSFSSVLKDIGTLRGNVARDAKLSFSPDPLSTRIIVDRDGSIVWDGVVTGYGFKASSSDRQLQASEYPWMLKRRRFAVDYTYTGWYDFDIVYNLVAYTQGLTGGNLNLNVVYMESPVVIRTQEYKSSQAKDIWGAISDLSNLTNGFEFRFNTYYDSTLNVKTDLLLAYRIGSPQFTTGWTYEYPGNVVDYEWDVDGTSTVNQLIGTCTDAANLPLRSTQNDSTLFAAYGLFEDTASFQDVKVQTQLDSRTYAQMWAERLPFAAVKLWLRPDSWPELGAAIVGDSARVRLTSPLHIVQSDGSPGFDDYLRLHQIDVTAPDQGKPEAIQLTFANILTGTTYVKHEQTFPRWLGNLEQRVDRLERNT